MVQKQNGTCISMNSCFIHRTDLASVLFQSIPLLLQASEQIYYGNSEGV